MVTECGLFLDIETPYIGASPDGLICCSCCGKGVLEVKCPLYVKDKFPEKDQDSFCMKKWLINGYLRKTMHIITRYRHRYMCVSEITVIS